MADLPSMPHKIALSEPLKCALISAMVTVSVFPPTLREWCVNAMMDSLVKLAMNGIDANTCPIAQDTEFVPARNPRTPTSKSTAFVQKDTLVLLAQN